MLRFKAPPGSFRTHTRTGMNSQSMSGVSANAPWKACDQATKSRRSKIGPDVHAGQAAADPTDV
jgi:hypothetical protein